MSYEPLEAPIEKKFKDFTNSDAKKYKQWFVEKIPERINKLTDYVNSTSGYESWVSDFSIDSLRSLSAWFSSNIRKKIRSHYEIDHIKAQLKYPFDVSNYELTAETASLSVDVAMYFSLVFLNNNSGLCWDSVLKPKNHADYGQPVIVGFNKIFLNPVRVVLMAAMRVAEGKEPDTALAELYAIWIERYLQPSK